MTRNWTYRVFNDDGTIYRVYCQFNPDRTGLAFPTKRAVERGHVDLDALWTNRTYVGIYVWLANGTEYETLVRPLANEEWTTELTVNVSRQAALPSADHSAGPYIYVTITDPQLSAASTVGYRE